MYLTLSISQNLVICYQSLVLFLAPPSQPAAPVIVNPCFPSPCGPYSECRDRGGYPSCTCLTGYVGAPPKCRPECSINAECSSNLACMREKCRDPCPGSCGYNALCNVINHTPICTCPLGMTGDPFTSCKQLANEREFFISNLNTYFMFIILLSLIYNFFLKR
jgi:hypothetical protein